MKINKLFLSIIVFGVLALCSTAILMGKVSAVGFSWVNGAIAGEVIPGPGPKNCTDEQVRIGSSTIGRIVDLCVFQAKDVRYSYYSDPENGYDMRFAIGFKGSATMYKIRGIPFRPPTFIPNSNDIIFKDPNSSDGFDTRIIKDLPSKLTRYVADGITSYGLLDVMAHSKSIITNENGEYTLTRSSGISPNGKWLVVELMPGGYVRINMETSEKLWFSKATNTSQKREYAISNDGRHIVLSGLNFSPKVYDVQNCGRVITVFLEKWRNTQSWRDEDINECVERGISQEVQNITGGTLRFTTQPSLSSDSGELTLNATYLEGSNPAWQYKWIKFRAPGYTPPPQLDYLALGDSYSSGEGDTQINPVTNTKYYRAYTDITEDLPNNIPREKCHLSTRSYPYKLALAMNFGAPRVIGAGSSKWQSVACSGARIYDTTNEREDLYLGQSRGDLPVPRLQGITNPEQLQLTALNEFIPGRDKQIKFVEKYRPKVITLTMGGNDAKFSDVIRACVDPTVEILSTCSYALDNSKKSNLAYAIKGQYSYLKSLYKELIAKAGDTRLYVLGYPQFANSVAANILCQANVRLNNEERIMAREGVTYMNRVIKAAAQASGAIYIHTESALESHKLCDVGEKAVTGIARISPSDEQESFHPNSKGHQLLAAKISQAVNNQSLLTYTCVNSALIACPDAAAGEPEVSPYFATAIQNNNPAINALLMVPKVVRGVAEAAITTDDFMLMAGSFVQGTLFSSPQSLGSFAVDSNGKLAAQVTIPANTPVGYHTLEITGKSYSGEPIKLWQIIEVQGSDPADRDDDGIVDTADPCMYVAAANADADFDKIDDACDSEISQSPQIYRVRNGNVSAGEQANYLYIERNMRASSVTGITNDTDPNNDGWAIVGTSQDQADSGKAANFWVDTNKKPHLSLRTEEDGCVQYTPSSLARVETSGIRTFTRESSNATTCRSEPAADDTDMNGVADNAQPLYKARNGIASQGEDVAKIYIERTTRTAEVKLKLSDYASADLTIYATNNDNRKIWSLLASSQDAATRATYKKLVLINDQPVILALNASSQCIALKPASLTVIKKSTQATRGLEQTTIPTGENCG